MPRGCVGGEASGRGLPPVNLLLPPFLQRRGPRARQTPAAPVPGTARAPRSPWLLGPLPVPPPPPRPSTVRFHPVGPCLGHPVCSDDTSRAHPVGGEGDAASRKQKKKKNRNGASVSNGAGKACEKPAPEESFPSPEAQARKVLRREGWRPRVHSGCETPRVCGS